MIMQVRRTNDDNEKVSLSWKSAILLLPSCFIVVAIFVGSVVDAAAVIVTVVA